jgi:CheY-like chemotaxis protein
MRKINILIADDSEKLLSALRIQLQSYGFEVRTCTDAYMALAQAQRQPPDVMMLDIRMPAGDGFSVLERMNKLPELRDVPVIYITGEKSSELDLKAERMGAHGLIHKPIILSTLLKLIESATANTLDNAGESSGGAELKEFDVSADGDASDALRLRS